MPPDHPRHLVCTVGGRESLGTRLITSTLLNKHNHIIGNSILANKMITICDQFEKKDHFPILKCT